MAKKRKPFAEIVLGGGLLLIALSLIIYNWVEIPYLLDVHSEIFGAGIALFAVGGLWALFRIKI